MTVAKFAEVLDGFEFGAFGAMATNQAFISLERGTVHFVSSELELEEDAPEDLDSGDYLALPDKAALGLGRELVMEFVQEQLPDDVDTVWGFFSKRGAYRRFKDFLERRGRIQAWYDYESAATEALLRAWCAEHGIELV